MHKIERAVLRDAVALTLFCAGLLWLAVALGLLRGGDAEPGSDYLAGVLSRSLDGAFQRALLAGLIAVPLHAIWTVFQYGTGPQVALAYERFAAWAQTLFTSLGFLGTIIGVSLAVAGLRAAMEAGEPSELIAGLSTAFDTTFLGLSAALLLLGFRKVARLTAEETA